MNINIKRTIGTGKIFWYSCGAVIAIATAVWLIINGIFAFNIAGVSRSYIENSSDVATPAIILLASAFTYYRYGKICAANNASGIMKRGVFSLMSVFVSAIFASADLLFTKLVIQNLHGGSVRTWLENECSYPTAAMRDYFGIFEDISIDSSRYSAGTFMIIFAAMTLYYYCFWVIGFYFAECFVCRQRKILVYSAITMVLVPVMLIYFSEIDAFFESLTMNTALPYVLKFFLIFLKLILMLMILVGAFSNPILVAFGIPSIFSKEINVRNVEPIFRAMILLSVLAFVLHIFTVFAGKGQYPDKRRIKQTLEKYEKKGDK